MKTRGFSLKALTAGLLIASAGASFAAKTLVYCFDELALIHEQKPPGPGSFLVRIRKAAGLAAPGTIYAAMTAQVRSKQTLLPLLLFPLIVPALLASVKATSLIILGDPMGQVSAWIKLLTAFDAIYWSLCGLLFGRVVEE